ncbi:MAG TPA: thioredoxin domain-containing protein [Gemmatimonadaceae bacterium]
MPSFSLLLPAATLAASLLAGCKPSTPGAEQAPAARVADSTKAAAATPDSALLARADAGRIQGPVDAPVWLVVASDFECPYCRIWHDQSYAELVRDYVSTGKVRMAYINYPLPMHRHAVPAAEAAMCASAQGKFWEMHSAIFGAQERWNELPDAKATFDSLAAATGVNMDDWRRCMTSHATLPLVEADAERTRRSGIQSTPSFMILRGNEMVEGISGAQPTAQFRAALDKALAGAK